MVFPCRSIKHFVVNANLPSCLHAHQYELICIILDHNDSGLVQYYLNMTLQDTSNILPNNFLHYSILLMGSLMGRTSSNKWILCWMIDGLIPLISATVYPMVSLCTFNTTKSAFSWASAKSTLIMTGKVLRSPKKTYMRWLRLSSFPVRWALSQWVQVNSRFTRQ